MIDSDFGETRFYPNSVIQLSGTIKRLPKKSDKCLAIIIWAFVVTFDSCHIAVALISSISEIKLENLTQLQQKEIRLHNIIN